MSKEIYYRGDYSPAFAKAVRKVLPDYVKYINIFSIGLRRSQGNTLEYVMDMDVNTSWCTVYKQAGNMTEYSDITALPDKRFHAHMKRQALYMLQLYFEEKPTFHDLPRMHKL